MTYRLFTFLLLSFSTIALAQDDISAIKQRLESKERKNFLIKSTTAGPVAAYDQFSEGVKTNAYSVSFTECSYDFRCRVTSKTWLNGHGPVIEVSKCEVKSSTSKNWGVISPAATTSAGSETNTQTHGDTGAHKAN
jgi:hypothetical protein